METPKRVAIYCRVSKGEDQTNENQTLELERYAKAMGYDYQIFEEEESSRKTRPIKNQLFQETIERKWDGILVWKLDRWARSLRELVNDLDILRQNNAEFFSLKDNIRLSDNATDQLMINILGSFAQFERDCIRERTLAGLARARSNGIRLGRPPKKIKQGQ
jgi:DNA invertase Pin-like site-specific DNA recombinase